METDGPRRGRASRWLRHCVQYVVAHAVAAAVASVSYAVLGVIVVLADPSDPLTGTFTVPMALGAALLIVPLGTFACGVLLIPVTLVAYPLALWVVRRGTPQALVPVIGAAAGVVIGIPLTFLAMDLGNPAAVLAQPWGIVRDGLPAMAVIGMTTGAGFGWIVARLERRAVSRNS